MIKTGTTCFSDSFYVHIDKRSIDGVARAVKETGIRGVLGRASMDTGAVPAIFLEDVATIIKEVERVIAEWNGQADGRIVICPEALFSLFCTPELWYALGKIADEVKTGIHCHAAESLGEVQEMRRQQGKSVIEYLDYLGVLRPDLLIAHAVWVTDREVQMLKANDVKICHNPISNQYIADGVAPVPHMLTAGITVGLGVDGAASNNNQDMFQAMKGCALMHKVASLDATRITAEQVLEMATIQSAKALGMDDRIGSLEPGKRADLIIINLDGKPNLAPNLKPLSNLVYSATSGDVDTVLIDGKIVMEKRKVKTVNEAQVIDESNRVAWEIVRKAGAKKQLGL
jgi:5-methylthioadenosine/S-adenosylhomocysteine deaminase